MSGVQTISWQTDRQHDGAFCTSIQLTKQRQHRKIPPYTGWPHQDTQETGTAELEHKTANNTSNDGLGSTTLSVLDQQIPHQSRWLHQLPQKMGTDTQCSSVRIWRDCDVHGTIHQRRPKLEPRFYKGIWLGKCASTGPSLASQAEWYVHVQSGDLQVQTGTVLN